MNIHTGPYLRVVPSMSIHVWRRRNQEYLAAALLPPVRLSVRVLLKQILSHLFHPADYLLVWLTRHVTHILNINAQQRNHDQHRDVIGEGKQTFRR